LSFAASTKKKKQKNPPPDWRIFQPLKAAHQKTQIHQQLTTISPAKNHPKNTEYCEPPVKTHLSEHSRKPAQLTAKETKSLLNY
jgi:hypothetical protein